MNLREENEGVNIILKQANKGIRKDKFSAFEYGLYYIKQEEDSKKKKRDLMQLIGSFIIRKEGSYESFKRRN